jgi:hypothetical protein
VISGALSTLTVVTGATTPAGTYPVTITGTAPSGSHSATLMLTVTVPVTNDFSIAVNPATIAVAQGQSAFATVTTAVTSGSAEVVSLSASGLPAGAADSFNPTSVTAGGVATLVVTVGSTTAAGTYPITVVGTGTSTTHSASLSLIVTGGATGGIANGGFEAGSLTGWSASGTTSVVSSGAHTGAYAAQVGGSSPTNDSSIVQTFTVPSGLSELSFWYQVVCPDTVQYDWATATLEDDTAGSTSTVLPHVCSKSGAWTQVIAPVTAGHSYTLTLVNHDDNYPSDPTFTLFDDVTLLGTPPPSPLVNGGFETGSFSGWTTQGTTSIVSSGAHGGVYAARVGGTNPTSGDSTIAQTFTPPAGSSQLSFWYEVVCPDTVQYDWATATLADNTTGSTTRLLANVCSNTGAWTQVTTAITAGHAYTLTLVSHDDNYPGDPTYTLYDDVTVQ